MLAGYIYSRLIDPLLKNQLPVPLGDIIEPESTVLDIGCGTGSMSFLLSEKAGSITGIDMSKSMISYADSRRKKLNIDNVNFIHEDALQFMNSAVKYDYSMFSFFLHSIDPPQRNMFIEHAGKISKRCIIIDYGGFFPGRRSEHIIRGIEFCAGKIHNRNFKNWVSSGGIEGFIKQHNLYTEKSISLSSEIGKIISASFFSN